MICTRCGKTKSEVEFTKQNRRKDNSAGLCRECKKQIDARYQVKRLRHNEDLPYFDLTPDALDRSTGKARIGVLMLYKYTDRETTKHKQYDELPNVGMKAILSELKEPYKYCVAEDINDFEVILIPLLSVMDVENLIYSFEKFAPLSVKPQIIVGGFGVMNIRLIMPYIDVAVFGRAEDQINEIVGGQRLFNVWRKATDPDLTGTYYIRQPRYLVAGEAGVGCHNKCQYCQYTHVRRPLGKPEAYNPGTSYGGSLETDWHALEITRPGHYTAAWDGWSQATRYKVSKAISNKHIADKLIGLEKMNGAVFIKIFQIVGYPWETKQSVLSDIADTYRMLKDIAPEIKTKIILHFHCTPFGPELLTPMQNEPADIMTNWTTIMRGFDKQVYGNLILIMSPRVAGPHTLAKRVMINRAQTGDTEAFKRIVFNRRLYRMNNDVRMEWLIKYGHIDMALYGRWDGKATEYLRVEPEALMRGV